MPKSPELHVRAPAAMAAALAALATVPAQDAAPTVERMVVAMGTTLRLELWAPSRAIGLRAAEAAVRAVEAAERRLSTWRPDSELAQLHAVPSGQPAALSCELARDLAAARSWWQATNGAFDPALGALVDAYDLRGAGRWPDANARSTAQRDSGFAHLDLAGRTAVRRRAIRLDAGGFGKGAGLDAAGHEALAAGATGVCLDFGGQVLVVGTPRPGARSIALADPRNRNLTVLRLRVDRGSLATTGNSERGRIVAGRRLGHVIDPRTGLPAADFGSVTVWSADAFAADCLSTALFVMGPDRALAWAAARADVEALVLHVDGDRLRARATPGLRALVEPLASDLALQ